MGVPSGQPSDKHCQCFLSSSPHPREANCACLNYPSSPDVYQSCSYVYYKTERIVETRIVEESAVFLSNYT
eukprot:scaffold11389_cov258-Ochromonas_danica.AAC.3